MYFAYIAQINNEGRQILVIESPYIWLDPSLLGDISNVPSSDLLPCVRTPLSQSSLSVCWLVSLCKVALRHNFISALLAIGGGLIALHYRKIVEVGDSRTIMFLCDNNLFVAVVFWMSHSVCSGPAETGKSTSIRAALSFYGKHSFLITELGILLLPIHRCTKVFHVCERIQYLLFGEIHHLHTTIRN